MTTNFFLNKTLQFKENMFVACSQLIICIRLYLLSSLLSMVIRLGAYRNPGEPMLNFFLSTILDLQNN